MAPPEAETCARCGTRIVQFAEDDGRPRLVCPRCEADRLSAIYEREPEPGGHGPGRPHRPRAS